MLNSTHIHEVINNSSMNEANNNVHIVDEFQDASSNVDMNDFYYSNISSRTISIPSERFACEKHSSGVATKIMNKMGYKGKGIGKRENGLMETIKIKLRKLGVNDTRKNVEKKDTGKTYGTLHPIGLHIKPNGRKKTQQKVGCKSLLPWWVHNKVNVYTLGTVVKLKP